MATPTLALGQASYQLLDAVDGVSNQNVTAAQLDSQQVSETLRAARRGGLISDLNIGVRDGYTFGSTATDGLGNLTAFNVADASRGLTFNDADLANSSITSNANLNFLANADQAILGLGAGDNRVNASRDLINSEIQALGGSDTVRIGGRADGSFVSLGDGADQLTVSRASTGLNVAMGAGGDTALFLGTLTAAQGQLPNEQGPSGVINDVSNIVDMGDGADRASFLGGVQGGIPGFGGYEIQLGEGADTAVFGGNSSSDGFVLNTGSGSDNVTLGRSTTNAVIDLGWDTGGELAAGDSLVLGLGASLSNSSIRSGQSSDTVRLAGTVTDTSLDLGWGASSVEVDGVVGFGDAGSTTIWDLGAGDDTLIFSELSDLSLLGEGTGFISLGTGADELQLLGSGYGGFGALEFDLGNDGDADTIVFGLNSGYSNFTVSNFGFDDILFIGAGSYGYGYSFLNGLANEWDLQAFQAAGNVIWAQVNDGADQQLMTLDTLNFESDTAQLGYLSTQAADGTSILASEEFIQQLSDPSAWSAVDASVPMSENPPSLLNQDQQNHPA